MPLAAREVDSALTSKGFKKVDRDHHFYFLWHAGKITTIRTKISHGEREISDTNCGLMARQMRLTTPQFRKFVDCTIREEHYIQMLMDAGHIERQKPK